MRQWDGVCPVCLREGVEGRFIESAAPSQNGDILPNRTHSDDAILVQCSACGEFVVTGCDLVNLRSERLRVQWSPAQLSALLREQTIRGLPPFWLRYGMDPYGPIKRENLAPIDLDELLRRWPRTVPERIDRTLCNLARLSPIGGHLHTFDPADTALAFAETPDEASYHLSSLVHRGYLDDSTSHQLVRVVSLTPDGWERFEELMRSANAPENPVFVAMWFGDENTKTEMDDVYERGIRPAINEAGYRENRVDFVEHNDWIMDQVLGLIRLAPFVVADFTGQRQGVYFEAGFARGLGIPVIHTCEHADLKNAHFDTRQLNHVVWTTPEELHKKLYHRIMGTVGPGPHSPAT
jgi:nucleoside 2-deoxyribosyltransferase